MVFYCIVLGRDYIHRFVLYTLPFIIIIIIIIIIVIIIIIIISSSSSSSSSSTITITLEFYIGILLRSAQSRLHS